MKGYLITLDGVEGSGKSTHAKLLFDYLKSKGYNVVLTKEPGATKLSRQIRNILLSLRNSDMSYLAELFLYLADRSQHVEEVIVPSIQNCKIVISDRFIDSTVAYQGYGRGISIDLINKLNKIATCSIKPDLTLILNTDVKAGLARAKKKKNKVDRIEKEEIKFHKKVHDGFLKIAKKEPGRVKIVRIKNSPIKTQLMLRKIVDDFLSSKAYASAGLKRLRLSAAWISSA